MFPKKNRCDRKTVEKVFQDGRFVNTKNLTFKYFIEKNSKIKHISFVVSKKISKKAVDRNKLRRRGYSLLKKYIDSLPQGIIGVFVFTNKSMLMFGGRKNTKHNPIQNLDDEIKAICSKIH